MKILLGLTLSLLASVGVVYACAEGEVWQSEISYETQCTEYTQVHTGHKLGINSEFVCWLTGNDWFKGKCYHGGHVNNICTEYETTETDNGQCVAIIDDEEDNGGDGDENGDTGEDNQETGQADNSSSSGTSLWTRLSNVSGIKYTKDNISLQEGLKLYDQIMAEKIERWNNRNK